MFGNSTDTTCAKCGNVLLRPVSTRYMLCTVWYENRAASTWICRECAPIISDGLQDLGIKVTPPPGLEQE